MGGRERIIFNGFRGIDPQPSGLYPSDAVYVPQDFVENGLLRYALNCRFDAGRAYWYRSQLIVPLPVKYPFTRPVSAIKTITRSGGVVTVETVDPHRFRYTALGGGTLVSISGTVGMDSEFNEVTSVPSNVTFTYNEAGADMSESTGTATAARPTALYEFLTDQYSQICFFTEDGNFYYFPNLDWSETPGQLGQGYAMFDTTDYASLIGVVPRVAPTGFAMRNNRLYIVGPADGVSASFSEYVPMLRWNGADISAIGFEPPATAPTGAADATGAGNRLVAGRYSYRVTYGNYEFESMEGPVVDVDVEYATASGYVEAKDLSTAINHGDSVTINGVRYRFVSVATLVAASEQIETGDIPIAAVSGATVEQNLATTLQRLATMVANGLTLTETGVTMYTAPHPDVTAQVSYVTGSRVRVALTAREAGVAGNALTLVESTSDARLHVSGATLSGGTSEVHIDLSSIPTSSESGVTWRKLYRAYTADTSEGVRGTSFQYLGQIRDNTTTTYADNTPQGELGEPTTYDRAKPPSGTILAQHKDRLWMSGVYRTSDSYAELGTVSAITRTGGDVTVTLTAEHGIVTGDQVTISGCTQSAFNGRFRVTAVPSATSFKFAQAGTLLTASDGIVEWGVIYTGLQNVLWYSALDEPVYWPVENQITVGSSAPILALVSWGDQLCIVKTDSVWLLTGYGEAEWRLDQLAGATGAIGPHAAASPYGLVWAGHTGWMFYDGSAVRCILQYGEVTSYAQDVEGVGRPDEYVEGEAPPQPMCCWHDERFHLADRTNERIYCWRPGTDTWEVLKRPIEDVGLRAFALSGKQSHILTCMKWSDVVEQREMTLLDHLYRWSTDYQRLNGKDVEGYVNYAQIELELPTIAAPVGELVNPIECAVYGKWDVPADDDDDLKLLIYDELNDTWDNIGTVTADARMGIPMGYAARHLRMKLVGERVEHFALHGLALIYTRRPARGA